MTPGLFDHLYVLLMMIVIPLHSWRTFPAALADIRARGEVALIAAYRQIILTFAGAALCVLVLWSAFDRHWVALGVRSGEPITQLTALAVAVAFVALVVLPIRSLLAGGPDDTRQRTVDAQLGDLQVFMPKSVREERWFYAVSVNAGITEEIIFRGYLIWYLQHFLSPLATAVVAVLAFTFAHLYQGLRQLPGIFLAATAAVATYLISGSLLVPILMHIVVDALQGRLIARYRRRAAIQRAEDGVSRGASSQ